MSILLLIQSSFLKLITKLLVADRLYYNPFNPFIYRKYIFMLISVFFIKYIIILFIFSKLCVIFMRILTRCYIYMVKGGFNYLFILIGFSVTTSLKLILTIIRFVLRLIFYCIVKLKYVILIMVISSCGITPSFLIEFYHFVFFDFIITG